jgi:hypothetical protein
MINTLDATQPSPMLKSEEPSKGVVSEVLRHSSVAITKDAYGHLVEGQKLAATGDRHRPRRPPVGANAVNPRQGWAGSTP